MSYTDWIESVLKYITNSKKLNILEFGCGLGTEFLLNNFNNVISYEISESNNWINTMIEKYKNYNNWTPYFHLSSDFNLNDNDNIILETRGKERGNIDNVLNMINKVNKDVNINNINVVFVDAGIYNRGEIAQYYINYGVDIIIIHDYIEPVLYGYDKLIFNNYGNILYDIGCKTMIFKKKVHKFQIFGERCSGTNYLENLLIYNFDCYNVNKYNKHFFKNDDYENDNDILFIGIVRDIKKWINSFYRIPHYLEYMQPIKKEQFLNDPIISKFNDNVLDYNIFTNEIYKNIFELRHIKLHYMVREMPKKMTNYILIRYEDLINDFENTLNRFKLYLNVKQNINYPINITQYKKEPYIYIPNNDIYITDEEIIKNKEYNNYFENILLY